MPRIPRISEPHATAAWFHHPREHPEHRAAARDRSRTQPAVQHVTERGADIHHGQDPDHHVTDRVLAQQRDRLGHGLLHADRVRARGHVRADGDGRGSETGCRRAGAVDRTARCGPGHRRHPTRRHRRARGEDSRARPTRDHADRQRRARRALRRAALDLRRLPSARSTRTSAWSVTCPGTPLAGTRRCRYA